MPPGAVTLRAKDNAELEISGENPQPVYTLRQLSEDFPKISTPAGTGTEVEGEGLAEAIKQVAPAASTDLGRAVLTGVLLESTAERLRMVATDSYRPGPAGPAGHRPGRDRSPAGRGGSGELPNTVGASQVKVSFTGREGVFGSSAGTLKLRMIEGNFPKYETLLPTQYPNRFICERETLLETIKRMELVAEDHYPIRLTIGDGGAEVNVIRQDVGRRDGLRGGRIRGRERQPDGGVPTPATWPTAWWPPAPSGSAMRIIDGMKPSVIDDPQRDEFLYLLMPVNV